MSREDLEAVYGWVSDWMYLIRADTHDTPPTVQWLLDAATSAVRRYGIRGLVIDPYNELHHDYRGAREEILETQYISTMLSKV